MNDDANGNPIVKIPIDASEVVAPITQSKSFASNLIGLVLLPLVWPWLPVNVKQSDATPAFIAAVYLLVNAITRELTRTRARKFVERLISDFDLPSVTPGASRDDINRL